MPASSLSRYHEAGIELPSGGLSSGDAGLRAIQVKRRRENFPVACRLLAGRSRRHLQAIYGFARLTDDVGDEVRGDRLALLDEVQKELDRAFAGNATHPIFVALSETVAACGLDKQPFLDLIQANRVDQRVSRYETFADLRDYCRLSAEPIGRLVLAVAGALTPERILWSDDVCAGLQIVEHLQDVGEDAARGRVYLPREDLDAFSVNEDGLTTRRATAELVRLVAFEAERARSLLNAGQPLAATLPGRFRMAIIGFSAGGLAVLDAMEAAGWDVLRFRVRGKKKRLLRNSLELLVRSGRWNMVPRERGGRRP